MLILLSCVVDGHMHVHTHTRVQKDPVCVKV